jgi:hypothetical protein
MGREKDVRATIAIATVLVWPLVGCSIQEREKTAAPDCSSNTCMIKVSVTGDCHSPANISVHPDTIGIAKNNHGPEIHWDIQTSGYTFPSLQTAVVFNTPPLPPTGEFTPVNLASNNTKLIMKDRNSPTSTPQTYKYTLNLVFNGAACTPKDPFIVNGK